MASRTRGMTGLLIALLAGGSILLASGAAVAAKPGTTAAHHGSPSRPDQDGTGADRGEADNEKPPAGDHNNGCGNDADREDDNNGWCGRPPFAGDAGEAGTAGGTTERNDDRTAGGAAGTDVATDTNTGGNAAVLGTMITARDTSAGIREAAVLGVRLERVNAASVEASQATGDERLATTGVAIAAIALAGAVLSLLGVGLSRVR